MRSLLLFNLLALFGLFVLCSSAAPPNILLILVDDMGYGDIACYGAPDAKTPVLDKLAADGVKYTHYYAAGAECTPTRTALLTGKYPQRAGGLECAIGTGNVGRYDDAIRLADKNELGLPPAQCVLAKPFADAGYTCGIFGKWHLGYPEAFNPLNYGFDRFFGCLGGNVDYFTHKELSPLPALFLDREPVERKGYMTHLITQEATAFIEEQQDKPFFCYVPYTTPHFPFQAPGDADAVFTKENWTAGTRETYVKMLEDMDQQVGILLDNLERAEIADRTLVIYASDHGAMKPGSNAPFNGWKGGTMEGGLRAPLIVRWPGVIEAGTVSKEVCITMDLTVSLLKAAGLEAKADGLDGVDMLGKTAAGEALDKRSLFWRTRRGDRTWTAVRDGNWKFVGKEEAGEKEEWLFNLKRDEGEANDLAEKRPEKVTALKKALGEWSKDVAPVR